MTRRVPAPRRSARRPAFAWLVSRPALWAARRSRLFRPTASQRCTRRARSRSFVRRAPRRSSWSRARSRSLVGVPLGIWVTRPSGRDFRAAGRRRRSTSGRRSRRSRCSRSRCRCSGFGFTPTIVALFLYGLFPVVSGTIAGHRGGAAGRARRGARAWGWGRGSILLARRAAARRARHPGGHPHLGHHQHRDGDGGRRDREPAASASPIIGGHQRPEQRRSCSRAPSPRRSSRSSPTRCSARVEDALAPSRPDATAVRSRRRPSRLPCAHAPPCPTSLAPPPTAHGMLPPGAPVLAMVSGGADSTALLRLLASGALGELDACASCTSTTCCAARPPTPTRRSSRRSARRLGVPCRVVRYDVAAYAEAEGLNLEDAGRRVRYRFAEEELDARARAAAARRGPHRRRAHASTTALETFLMRAASRARARAASRASRPCAAASCARCSTRGAPTSSRTSTRPRPGRGARTRRTPTRPALRARVRARAAARCSRPSNPRFAATLAPHVSACSPRRTRCSPRWPTAFARRLRRDASAGEVVARPWR